jgi:hypothetical protein
MVSFNPPIISSSEDNHGFVLIASIKQEEAHTRKKIEKRLEERNFISFKRMNATTYRGCPL